MAELFEFFGSNTAHTHLSSPGFWLVLVTS